MKQPDNSVERRALSKELYARDRSYYIAMVEISATRDQKVFWQYVRSLYAGKNAEIINLFDDNRNPIGEIADAFAEPFSSVFLKGEVDFCPTPNLRLLNSAFPESVKTTFGKPSSASNR